jgi:hypothetical protein
MDASHGLMTHMKKRAKTRTTSETSSNPSQVEVHHFIAKTCVSSLANYQDQDHHRQINRIKIIIGKHNSNKE